MITDTFLNNLAKWANGESANTPSYVGYSSTVITPDATHTSIANEHSRGSTANSRSLNRVVYNDTKSGSVLSGDETINTILLWNGASSTAELCAEAIVPSLTHTSDFDIDVDWTISFERKG